MAKAKDLEARDAVDVAGEHVALVEVETYTEDGETWIYATDVNGNEYEWRENEDVTIVDSFVVVTDYIDDCNSCERPAHLCACP